MSHITIKKSSPVSLDYSQTNLFEKALFITFKRYKLFLYWKFSWFSPTTITRLYCNTVKLNIHLTNIKSLDWLTNVISNIQWILISGCQLEITLILLQCLLQYVHNVIHIYISYKSNIFTLCSRLWAALEWILQKPVWAVKGDVLCKNHFCVWFCISFWVSDASTKKTKNIHQFLWISLEI